jgi:uncharacterized protein (TIGR00730 family)
MSIKSLTIYCSSSENLSNNYYDLAKDIGNYLAKNSIKVIYGGGKTGIMGKIAKSAIVSGGEVVGIIPEFLATKEKINYETTETIIVNNMSERKIKLFEMADAFLILPGGSGTIEEATEIISWKILGIHNKKIIIFNFNNFWDPLIEMYSQSKIKKFGNTNLQNICIHVKTIKEFINYISNEKNKS